MKIQIIKNFKDFSGTLVLVAILAVLMAMLGTSISTLLYELSTRGVLPQSVVVLLLEAVPLFTACLMAGIMGVVVLEVTIAVVTKEASLAATTYTLLALTAEERKELHSFQEEQ